LPTVGWKAIINEAVPVAFNEDRSGIITVYNAGPYTAVYISYMPEYKGGRNDTQLLYNALTLTSGNQCKCKIESLASINAKLKFMKY
jgi:hypothetical protein